MPRYVDLNNPKLIHMGRDKFGDGIYHIIGVPLPPDLPTAEVVEVVRCKDCKYGIDWDGRLGCEWHGFYQTEPNWFCADGERKE